MSNLKITFQLSDAAQQALQQIADRRRELIDRVTQHGVVGGWETFTAERREIEDLYDMARDLIANDIVDQLDEYYGVLHTCSH